jgi:hypothetical protein
MNPPFVAFTGGLPQDGQICIIVAERLLVAANDPVKPA